MLDWQEILLRLVMASVFGALVGLERERKNWSAGMRTHMMVCVGSCLIMLVSSFGFSDMMSHPSAKFDPARVAAQVVSGIGFIGAGTIMFQQHGVVRGLTTAAGLWTVAGVGLATGGGMYITSSIATVIVLIILWGLQPVEKRYARRFVKQNLRIVTEPKSNEIDLINKILNENSFKVQNFNMSKHHHQYVFNIRFESADSSKMAKLIDKLREHDSVKEVFWGH